MSNYKLAPTFLFNQAGDSRLFETQDEVDAAWLSGWFGPPWLLEKAKLISEREWASKQEMIDAVLEDPRYDGYAPAKRKNVETLMEEIVTYEKENPTAFTTEEE